MVKIEKIESSTKFLDKSLEIIALVFLLVSVSLAFFGVVSRSIFNVSYPIVEEIARYSIVYGVFMYIGPLVKKGEHISMDLLQTVLKKRMKHVNSLIIDVILFVSFVFLFWNGVKWVTSLFEMKITTSSGLILQFIPTLVIPVGMFLGCVYSLLEIIKDVVKIGSVK